MTGRDTSASKPQPPPKPPRRRPCRPDTTEPAPKATPKTPETLTIRSARRHWPTRSAAARGSAAASMFWMSSPRNQVVTTGCVRRAGRLRWKDTAVLTADDPRWPVQRQRLTFLGPSLGRLAPAVFLIPAELSPAPLSMAPRTPCSSTGPHDRPGARAGRLGRQQEPEPDGHLHHARPRRPLVQRRSAG